MDSRDPSERNLCFKKHKSDLKDGQTNFTIKSDKIQSKILHCQPAFSALGFCRHFHCRSEHLIPVLSGFASPKKVVGPNHFSLLVSSNSGIHSCIYIYMKTFQWICTNLRRDLNRSGGLGPPFPRVDAIAGAQLLVQLRKKYCVEGQENERKVNYGIYSI